MLFPGGIRLRSLVHTNWPKEQFFQPGIPPSEVYGMDHRRFRFPRGSGIRRVRRRNGFHPRGRLCVRRFLFRNGIARLEGGNVRLRFYRGFHLRRHKRFRYGLGFRFRYGLGFRFRYGLGFRFRYGLGFRFRYGLGFRFRCGLGFRFRYGLGFRYGYDFRFRYGLGFRFCYGLGFRFRYGLGFRFRYGYDFRFRYDACGNRGNRLFIGGGGYWPGPDRAGDVRLEGRRLFEDVRRSLPGLPHGNTGRMRAGVVRIVP
jgi:hypothetical protein